MDLAALLVDDEPVAVAHIAATRHERRRGLLGRDGFDDVMAFPGIRSVHTVGVRFPLDVAFARYLDGSSPRLPVRAIVTEVVAMRPNRIGRPRRCDLILEAERGAMAQWGIEAGVSIEIKPEGTQR